MRTDTKDWTWVLSRRCPECGFDASAGRDSELADLIRRNAANWQALHAEGIIATQRPEPSVWSPLEYACHVRDVYRRFFVRVDSMLVSESPYFPNWDQDQAALEDRYSKQNPHDVIADLTEAAETLATRLEGLDVAQWERPGRRSDGASFTVASLSRYMLHDTTHHLADIAQGRQMHDAAEWSGG